MVRHGPVIHPRYHGAYASTVHRAGDPCPRTSAPTCSARPSAGYEAIRDHLAFYAGLVDEAWVGDELAMPQPGRFYGGWVTSNVVGPFKGSPGTLGW